MGGAGAGGKTRDPIAPANGDELTQIEEIEIHGHCEGINAGTGCHAEAAGIDPGQADESSGI